MKLWRDIIDSLPDAIIVLSGTFEPMSVNPAAETMLGTSSITRPQLTDLLEHNPWLDRMVRNCLKTGQSVGDPDTVLGMGPRSITVRTEVSPLLNEDGRAQGAIIQLHDLAHQKSAAQVTDSSELSLRLSPAGLAHEIKNPLTGIKGAAELLSAMYPAEQRVQQYYAVIRDGVNRITGLVEEVLAVSAPQRLVKEPVNIHQVLHQALRMAGLYPKAPEAIRIEQDFDPSLPEVSGDAAALERAFLNLVKNAHEALGTSGTIRMHTRIETEFRMTNDGQRLQFLRVEISDNGVGIGRRCARAALYPVLHHQACRNRARPGAQPADYRAPRRTAMGDAGRIGTHRRRERAARRNDVQGHAPDWRGQARRRHRARRR